MKHLLSLPIVLIGAMALCFAFARDLLEFVTLPMSRSGIALHSGSLIGSFQAALLVAFYGALTLTLPVLVYLLGEFLRRDIPREKRRPILPALFVGAPVYLAGAWLAHRYLAPMPLNYFNNISREMGLLASYDLTLYLRFIALLCISGGLLCALPATVIILSRMEVVTHRGLSHSRFYAMTAIVLLAAFTAPAPDTSMLALLAAPFLVVYELCIWVVWFLERRRAGVDYAHVGTGAS